jgi:biotin carboxyl carrier protein
MLGDLGQNYLDTGHYKEAQVLYKELLKVDGSSNLVCAYQTHITEAVMAANPANKPLIVGELDVQLKMHEEFARAQHDAHAWAGDLVAAGDPLLGLESMKTETTVKAPRAGRARASVGAGHNLRPRGAAARLAQGVRGSAANAAGRGYAAAGRPGSARAHAV